MMPGRDDFEILKACVGTGLLGMGSRGSDLIRPLAVVENDPYELVSMRVAWPVRFVKSLSTPAARLAVSEVLGATKQ